MIKKCPFCGSAAKVVKHVFHGAGDTYSVKCTVCKVETWGFYSTQKKAEEAWNKRVEE